MQVIRQLHAPAAVSLGLGGPQGPSGLCSGQGNVFALSEIETPIFGQLNRLKYSSSME
jgi:hypothetical protein